MRKAELVRYLVLAAQREGSRRLTQELRAIRLTPSQSEVLRILGDHGPLSLTGLGELLVCESGSNPSRLVDRLVGAGLVERVVAAEDDGVLAGVGRAGQLERDHASAVGDDQILRRQAGELRTSRRHVTLSLTYAGREMEAAVRAVEERLYVDLDAVSVGVDLQPVIQVLRLLSAGEPAGDALEKRIAAQADGSRTGA